jgi:hypothetical protein
MRKTKPTLKLSARLDPGSRSVSSWEKERREKGRRRHDMREETFSDRSVFMEMDLFSLQK